MIRLITDEYIWINPDYIQFTFHIMIRLITYGLFVFIYEIRRDLHFI